MKFLTLILACVALAGCKPKKLSYRDPFYFGRTDTAKMYLNSPLGKLILMRSTHDQYAWAGTVPGQEELRPQPKFDSVLTNPGVYSINMHIKPIGNNRFMYNYSCISGDNQCFFIFRGDTIKIEIIKLDK